MEKIPEKLLHLYRSPRHTVYDLRERIVPCCVEDVNTVQLCNPYNCDATAVVTTT